MSKSARIERSPEAVRLGAHIRSPSRRLPLLIHMHPPIRSAHQPNERTFWPLLPAPDAGPL